MKPKKSPPKAGGFTLVELLVVIVIIAALVALSLVGYTKFRSAGDKTVTTSILREIQIASGNYAADNNGKFVPASGKDKDGKATTAWHQNREFLNNLRGDLFSTSNTTVAKNFPAEKLDPKSHKLKSPGYDHVKGNFGAFEKDPSNDSWGTNNWESSFTLAQLATPQRTAAFATALDWRIKSWKNYTGNETSNGQGRMAFRHDGKALVVFYDGHVEALSKADMQNIDDKGGKNHPFWNGSN